MADRNDDSTAWAWLLCAAVIIAVGTGFVARASGYEATVAGRPSTWAAQSTPTVARSRLARMSVTEPSFEIAYDRTRDFGPAWVDVDHNGCDTRNDILARDLTGVTYRSDDPGCTVASGILDDPYRGTRLRFTKSDANAVQIDHLVPLHAAWLLGAWRWPAARRLAFANDPRNLVAVDGPSNQDKSDATADRWLPDDTRVHCVYAINTVAVHAAYRLPVTEAEQHALARLLDRCS